MAKIGDEIGPYTLEKFLGSGGFGEVWLADNPQDLLYQKVAIKLARSEDITLDMIKSEALLWRSVSGNENIIPFIEAKNYDGQIIIVSEFADDGSLQDYLTNNGGKIGIRESESILQDILKGLEYLHSKGIGHFDLKPANILIKEGKFCLADFGLSKILVTENTSKGAGTISYSPPELFNRKRSLQSDIWSVGVILQKMLTGKMPFEGDSEHSLMFSIIQDEPRPLPNEIPQLYKKLVSKCLQKDIKNRFQTADEMREALKNPQKAELEKERLQREKEEQQRLEKERLEREAETQRLQYEREETLRKQKEAEDALKRKQEEEKRIREREIERQKAAEEARRLQEIEAKRRQDELDEIQRGLKSRTPDQPSSNLWKWIVGGVSGFLLFIFGIVGIGIIGNSLLSNNNNSTVGNSVNKSAINTANRNMNMKSTNKLANTSTTSGNSDSFKNSIGMEFVKIPAGSFMMGSPTGSFIMGSPTSERDRSDDEKQHQVTISKDFYMGKYEVTQAQWKTIMSSNPSNFKGDNLPVENISWEDAQKFIKKLNAKGEGTYRLPTEAEWEYAARAGTTGDYAGNLDSMAWYSTNSGSKTHEVGNKQANSWGLYDMHGNVFEWCQDWYNSSYSDWKDTDPIGFDSGSDRVFRGGCWYSGANGLRSAARGKGSPSFRYSLVGFRLVRN